MLTLLSSLLGLLLSPRKVRVIALENLALRQQLAVMKRQFPRPRLRKADRLFWVWLSGIWPHWQKALLLVRPETVVSWHRQGFCLFWSWISRPKRSGRPGLSPEVRDLIRKMAAANPLWGIHGELLKLGIDISERTVSLLLPCNRKPPSSTGKAFLNNHVKGRVSIDFFTFPTATFRVLFVLVVPARRSLQRDAASNCWVDRAADAGSFSRGYGAALPAARPG